MLYSELTNGHLIPARLDIGSSWMTQWGPRKVVKHVWYSLECTPDEPEPQYSE